MGIGFNILLHNRRRFIASGLGVGVAVIIVFIEMGYFFGVLDSQTNVARLVQGELIVLHRARTHLNKWNRFPRLRLDQMAAFEEVERAIPLFKGTVGLLNRDTEQVRRIVTIAFPPETPPLDLGVGQEITDRLKRPGTVLFDRRSRRIYGSFELGEEVWVDGKTYFLAGFADIGPTIVNDGMLVMSEGTWLAHEPDNRPVMGVLRLRPGVAPEVARQRIASAGLDDVTVLTRQALLDREISFTMTAAPIGLLFGFGVIAGLLVGTMVCYQILYNEITDHLSQYATLRAMGFPDAFIRRIIFEQAALLALIGYVIGSVVAWGVYVYVQRETALIMRFTWDRGLLVLFLTVGMCVAGGLFAMRRVTVADPAELY
jgi:putative ABC transport system permease protein